MQSKAKFGKISRNYLFLFFLLALGTGVSACLYESERENRMFLDRLPVYALLLGACAGITFIRDRRSPVDLLEPSEADRSGASLAKRYDYMAKFANDIFIISDTSGNIVEVNDRALAAYGYSRDELLSMNRRDLRTAESVKTLDFEQEQVGQHNGYIYETMNRRKDGTVFPVEVSSRLIDLNGTVYYWAIARDITERRHNEAEVLRTNRRFAVLSRLNHAIARTRDRQELFREAVRIAVEDGGFRTSWIGLPGPFGGNTAPAACFGKSGSGYIEEIQRFAEADPELPEPVISAGRRGVLSCCNDIAADPATASWRDPALKRGFLSCAAVPIRLGSDVMGAFGVYASEARFFNDPEMKLLEEIGRDLSFALDIFQQDAHFKLAREMLRESEHTYRTIFESNGAATVIIEDDTSLSLANREMERLIGYSAEELQGKKLSEFIPVQDLETVAANHRARRENPPSAPAGYESRLIDRQGNIIHVHLNAALIPGTKRSVVSLVDISRRKHAEELRRESEEKYRLLFSQTVFAVAMFDLETARFIEVNDSFLRLYGYAREEILGASVYEISAEPELTEQAFEEMKINGHSRIAKRIHRKKDGTLFPVEIEANTFPLKGRTIFSAVIKDITDRHKAEESLRRSESRFKAIFDNAGDAIFIHDLEGRILEANELACKSLGYSCEELTRMRVRDINAPRHASLIPEQTEILVRSGFLLFETVHVRKDGSTFPVEASSRIVRIDEIPAVLKIARDISERKFLEVQNRQAQKMEAIGTLAGGIAHDFNNTLGIMMSYSELGKMNASDAESVAANLDQVIKAGKRAKELVRQILSFSRQNEQEKTPVFVGILVKEAMKLLRASLLVSIQIDQHISSSGRAMASPSQIHQIVMNLCTNAAHAMREKGGRLEVRLTDVCLGPGEPVLRQGLQPGPHLELTVRDTGHGIDPAILDRVFEPYFTTKNPAEGTGLGLAVVHGIVRNINGAIEVQSEPGKGTCFRLLFPKLEGTVEPEAEKPLCIAGGRESILFVDDEAGLVDTARALLHSLGYEVTGTTSSLEALELYLAEPGKFDLIITDQTMPDLSGLELSRKILSARPNARIVLSTGFSEENLERELETIGIRNLLLKPLTLHDMARVIRSVLDGNESTTGGISDAADGRL